MKLDNYSKKNSSIAIGVDIGGSHISSAGVDIATGKTLPETYFYGFVNSKGTKEVILKSWAKIINCTIASMRDEDIQGIGFAIPGPFHYKTGVALYEGNDKYESLYNLSVPEELLNHLDIETIPLKFLNDATAFAVGGTFPHNNKKDEKVVAVTLGTGFGSAFIESNLPIIDQENVPLGGYLWDKPFKKGIADDYFSTRWFLNRYEELTGEKVLGGVKEMLDKNNSVIFKIFQEFANNFDEFLFPYLKKFQPDLLIIGGSIVKSHHLFLHQIIQNLKEKGLEIPIKIIKNTEEASIIGSSYLFNEDFWIKIKDELPEV